MVLFFLVIKNDSIANINVFSISSKRNAKKITSPPALPRGGGSQPYGLFSCNHTKLRYFVIPLLQLKER